MKLISKNERGEEVLVEIEPPVSIRHGEHLDVITDANGVDHWFTKDGHYDGWGQSLACDTQPQG